MPSSNAREKIQQITEQQQETEVPQQLPANGGILLHLSDRRDKLGHI